jgi:hypothetical protein
VDLPALFGDERDATLTAIEIIVATVLGVTLLPYGGGFEPPPLGNVLGAFLRIPDDVGRLVLYLQLSSCVPLHNTHFPQLPLLKTVSTSAP